MDDFLYNLRSGNINGNNRTKHHNQKHNYDRMNGNGRPNSNNRKSKGAYKAALEMLQDDLVAVLPEIKSLLEENLNYQKQMLSATETRARAEESKASALETIAFSLLKLTGQRVNIKPAEAEEAVVVRFPSDSSKEIGIFGKMDTNAPHDCQVNTFSGQLPIIRKTTGPSREDVMVKIKAMRDSGLSFKQVAEYLESENIPTFSGRGKWHAPTIANLLK